MQQAIVDIACKSLACNGDDARNQIEKLKAAKLLPCDFKLPDNGEDEHGKTDDGEIVCGLQSSLKKCAMRLAKNIIDEVNQQLEDDNDCDESAKSVQSSTVCSSLQQRSWGNSSQGGRSQCSKNQDGRGSNSQNGKSRGCKNQDGRGGNSQDENDDCSSQQRSRGGKNQDRTGGKSQNGRSRGGKNQDRRGGNNQDGNDGCSSQQRSRGGKNQDRRGGNTQNGRSRGCKNKNGRGSNSQDTSDGCCSYQRLQDGKSQDGRGCNGQNGRSRGGKNQDGRGCNSQDGNYACPSQQRSLCGKNQDTRGCNTQNGKSRCCKNQDGRDGNSQDDGCSSWQRSQDGKSQNGRSRCGKSQDGRGGKSRDGRSKGSKSQNNCQDENDDCDSDTQQQELQCTLDKLDRDVERLRQQVADRNEMNCGVASTTDTRAASRCPPSSKASRAPSQTSSAGRLSESPSRSSVKRQSDVKKKGASRSGSGVSINQSSKHVSVSKDKDGKKGKNTNKRKSTDKNKSSNAIIIESSDSDSDDDYETAEQSFDDRDSSDNSYDNWSEDEEHCHNSARTTSSMCQLPLNRNSNAVTGSNCGCSGCNCVTSCNVQDVLDYELLCRAMEANDNSQMPISDVELQKFSVELVDSLYTAVRAKLSRPHRGAELETHSAEDCVCGTSSCGNVNNNNNYYKRDGVSNWGAFDGDYNACDEKNGLSSTTRVFYTGSLSSRNIFCYYIYNNCKNSKWNNNDDNSACNCNSNNNDADMREDEEDDILAADAVTVETGRSRDGENVDCNNKGDSFINGRIKRDDEITGQMGSGDDKVGIVARNTAKSEHPCSPEIFHDENAAVVDERLQLHLTTTIDYLLSVLGSQYLAHLALNSATDWLRRFRTSIDSRRFYRRKVRRSRHSSVRAGQALLDREPLDRDCLSTVDRTARRLFHNAVDVAVNSVQNLGHKPDNDSDDAQVFLTVESRRLWREAIQTSELLLMKKAIRANFHHSYTPASLLQYIFVVVGQLMVRWIR